MTLQLLARTGLALWFVYSIASYGEGLRARGSFALRTFGVLLEIAFVTAFIWAGWWS